MQKQNSHRGFTSFLLLSVIMRAHIRVGRCQTAGDRDVWSYDSSADDPLSPPPNVLFPSGTPGNPLVGDADARSGASQRWSALGQGLDAGVLDQLVDDLFGDFGVVGLVLFDFDAGGLPGRPMS